jgi:predicted PurR-regulated permease PerM
LIGTNGPMTVLGVTDPRTWGVVGWISDLIPHFGHGLVTALVLRYLYPLSRPTAGTRRTAPDEAR